MARKPNLPLLVDQLGQLKAEQADLKAKISAIEETLLTAAPNQTVEGALFKATTCSFERDNFSPTKAKAFLTPTQIASCLSSSTVRQVRVSAR